MQTKFKIFGKQAAELAYEFADLLPGTINAAYIGQGQVRFNEEHAEALAGLADDAVKHLGRVGQRTKACAAERLAMKFREVVASARYAASLSRQGA
jgi:enoyl-[acyl-carrier-protein] reductase (NADH)